MTVAYVGLGSNVGDRLGFLRDAIAALDAEPGVQVRRCSPVYETDPIGPPQPDYLNAVVEVEASLGPHDLLDALKAVERSVGRTPAERWGPREIDLDLLLFGDEVIDDGTLRVPHPEMASRAFVLVPLADLDPAIDVPGHGRVDVLLETARRDGVRTAYPPDVIA